MESTITEASDNHLKKNENGKFVKQKMVDKFMHTKCSTESCFGSYSNKKKEVKDSKSLGVYGLIYEDNGIETSKKPTPVTSIMEEFEHEYPLSSKKHCVEAVTLACPSLHTQAEVLKLCTKKDITGLWLSISHETEVGVIMSCIQSKENVKLKYIRESGLYHLEGNLVVLASVADVRVVGQDSTAVLNGIIQLLDFLITEVWMFTFDPGGCRSMNHLKDRLSSSRIDVNNTPAFVIVLTIGVLEKKFGWPFVMRLISHWAQSCYQSYYNPSMRQLILRL